MKKFYIGGASGETTNYDNDANWEPFSLRNSSLQWTAGGGGTNEFYLEASGGGNPAAGDLLGLLEPQNVYEGGTVMTAGSADSLAAGEWDWADSDGLGFSTIYVRLTSGSANPDARDTNHVTGTDTPNANDDVCIIPNTTGASSISNRIDSGLDQGSVELDDFTVSPDYTGKIGLATESLTIDMGDANAFRFAGRGRSYIDVGTAAIRPVIAQTSSATTGTAGLYLSGTAMVLLTVESGTVQLNAATVTTLEIRSGATLIVNAASTTTTR